MGSFSLPVKELKTGNISNTACSSRDISKVANRMSFLGLKTTLTNRYTEKKKSIYKAEGTHRKLVSPGSSHELAFESL